MKNAPRRFAGVRQRLAVLGCACLFLFPFMQVWGVVPDDVFPFPTGVSNLAEIKLVEAEYFIDSDPGEGNGTLLDAEDLVFDQTTEQLKQLSLNLDGLAGGERRVGVRIKDDQGNWSTVSYVDVYMIDLTTVDADAIADSQVDRITIDNLPAVGTNVSVDLNGTGYTYQVKVGDDLNAVREGLLSSLIGNSLASVSFLPGGVLELRGKQTGSSYTVSSSGASVQANGTGAILPNGTNELIERKIMAAEYFIETDPGEGSGITIDAEDLVYDQATEQLKQLSLNVDGLVGGERRVGVRVQDDQGNWSTVSFVDVYMTDLTSVEADTIADSQVDRITIDNLPAVGTNVSVDLNGTVYTYQVKAEDDLNAVREGLLASLNGNSVASVSFLPGGVIELRGKQMGSSYTISSNEASVQANGTGAILPSGTNELTERKILAAEYFVKTDPGEGSGITIDAEDLVYDQATEQLKQLSLNLDGLAGGERRVGVRVQDDLGNWSTVSYVDVYMTDLTSVEADAIADSQVDRITIDNLPAVGTNVSVDLNGTGYTYQVNAGDDLNAVREGLLASLNGNSVASVSLLPGGILELRGKQTGSSYAVSSSEASVQADGTGAILPDGTNELTERKILTAEYFIETDPGEGSGLTIDAEDLVYDQATEQLKQLSLNLDGLAGGERRVGVRVQDDLGNWSTVSFVDIYMTDLTSVEADAIADSQVDRITIDNLPAVGSNVSVDLNGTGYTYQVKAGDDLNGVREGLLASLNGNSVASVSLLPGGILELRGKQTGSSYAVSSSEASVQADGTGAILPFGTNKLTERKILTAEYFIETDPGEGSGITIDAEDLVYDQATEQLKQLSLNLDGLAGGERRVGVRVKDDLGNWSTVSFVDIYMTDLTDVEADEFGSTQSDRITIDHLPAVGSDISVKIGPKNFTYQVKDGDDLSMVREGLMGALSGSPIVYVKSNPDGSISLGGRKNGHEYDVEAGNETDGQSVLAAGPMFPKGIPDTVIPQIKGAEYFIDSDPGEGNGLSVGAEDLAYDSATEGIAALSVGINDVPAGARRMGLRFRDQDGKWSTPRYIDFESEDAGEYIPSRVEINPRSIDENLTPGNWQGTLSTVDWNDPDANGTYTYALVNDNTTDNSSFSISGNDITATRMFDYELEKSLSLKVRTTDDTNRSVITNLTIRVNDNRLEDLDQDGLTQSEEGQLGTSDVQTDSDGDGVSDHAEVLAGSDPLFAKSVPGQAPKNLRLDPDTVQENQTVGSIVSRLFTDDPDDPQGRCVCLHF